VRPPDDDFGADRLSRRREGISTVTNSCLLAGAKVVRLGAAEERGAEPPAMEETFEGEAFTLDEAIFAFEEVIFAFEEAVFAFEEVAFTFEEEAFALEAGAFALEAGAFVLEAGAFAEDWGVDESGDSAWARVLAMLRGFKIPNVRTIRRQALDSTRL
jgi:hypothetical protein